MFREGLDIKLNTDDQFINSKNAKFISDIECRGGSKGTLVIDDLKIHAKIIDESQISRAGRPQTKHFWVKLGKVDDGGRQKTLLVRLDDLIEKENESEFLKASSNEIANLLKKKLQKGEKISDFKPLLTAEEKVA